MFKTLCRGSFTFAIAQNFSAVKGGMLVEVL